MVLLLTACDKSDHGEPSPKTTITHKKNIFSKAEIDEVLNQYKNKEKFMGSVAIFKDSKIIYTYATGYSDYANKKPSTPDTKFRIASITKSFTAILALMAAEEGKIKLSDTLDNYFPAIPNANIITIEQMLKHRSGLRSYTSHPDFITFIYEGKTVDEMLDIISSYESDFEPGTKESYSNSNAYLLTLILEKIYADSYANLISSKITQPLQLKNTYYAEGLSSTRNEAYSYHNQSNTERSKDAHHSVMLGAGGLVSKPTDLVKLYYSLFNGKVLSQQSLNRMMSTDDTFGLGIQKITYSGKNSFGHRGRVDDFNSIVIHNLDENFTLAVTDNSSFTEIPAMVKDIYYAYFKDASVLISAEELEKFVGTYKPYNPENHDAVFEREGDKLIHVIAGEYRSELLYEGSNTFLLDQSYAPAITITFSEDGSKLKLEFSKDNDKQKQDEEIKFDYEKKIELTTD